MLDAMVSGWGAGREGWFRGAFILLVFHCGGAVGLWYGIVNEWKRYPLASTRYIAKRIGVHHTIAKRWIQRYQKDSMLKEKPKKGRVEKR